MDPSSKIFLQLISSAGSTRPFTGNTAGVKQDYFKLLYCECVQVYKNNTIASFCALFNVRVGCLVERFTVHSFIFTASSNFLRHFLISGGGIESPKDKSAQKTHKPLLFLKGKWGTQMRNSFSFKNTLRNFRNYTKTVGN